MITKFTNVPYSSSLAWVFLNAEEKKEDPSMLVFYLPKTLGCLI